MVNAVYSATYLDEPVAASEALKSREHALIAANSAARTMGRLILHPNIIRYIGLCEYRDREDAVPRLFLVTELAPFGSLLNLLYGRVGPPALR